jgi:hypothetical protein
MPLSCQRTEWQTAAVARKGAYASAWAGACVLGLVPAGPALAIDLSNDPSLVTETVAGRDRLRYYDRIKIFGAERVADRDRKFAQPEGLRLGDFFFLPTFDNFLVYDDNIYAKGTDPIADMRYELSPVLRMHSQLPRHSLSLTAGARSVSYLENSDQDFFDLFGQIRGGLDIDSAHTLSASFTSSIDHEERSEITAPQAAAEPGEIHKNSTSVGITRDVGRLYGTLSAAATWLDYLPVKANDGSILDQDHRDQQIYTAQMRAGYRISPGFESIAKARLIRRENDGDEETERDSTGYELVAGLNMEMNPLIRWQFVAGYGIRDFDRPDFDSVGTYLLEAQAEWLITQRLSLYGTLSHKIDDALGDSDAGRIETAIKTSFEYEIYHNLVGHGSAAFRHSEQIGADRIDMTYEGSLGLDYYYTKNWLLTLDYHFQHRDSSEDEFSMTRNQVRVGAKLKF